MFWSCWLSFFDIGLKKAPFTESHQDVEAYSIQVPETETSVTNSNPTQTASDSPDGESKFAAGQAAIQAQKYAQAIKLFEEIIADTPSMKAQVLPAYTDALRNEASLLIDKEPDKAKDLTMKALALDPNDISTLSQLGYLYLNRQEYSHAIETYQKAAKLDPKIPDTFFNLGYVFAITGDYPKSREMYAKTVALEPSFLDEALFNLAMVNAELNELQECRKNLQKAIKINPKNEAAKAYLSQLEHREENN